MKKSITYIALLLFCCKVEAQTAIGTDNPNSSAMLDVTSTAKGVLPPRMTQLQRDAIVNPAKGLVVYCTNCNAESLYLNVGTPAVPNWRPCTSSTVANVTGTLISNGPIISRDASYHYTGSYIDLPPGKWMVNVVMLISPSNIANTWVKTSFSDSATPFTPSPDIIGSFLISGKAINAYGEVTGFVIINNLSNSTKRYHYHVNSTESYLNSFGGSNWGENQIFAIPVN